MSWVSVFSWLFAVLLSVGWFCNNFKETISSFSCEMPPASIYLESWIPATPSLVICRRRRLLSGWAHNISKLPLLQVSNSPFPTTCFHLIINNAILTIIVFMHPKFYSLDYFCTQIWIFTTILWLSFCFLGMWSQQDLNQLLDLATIPASNVVYQLSFHQAFTQVTTPFAWH